MNYTIKRTRRKTLAIRVTADMQVVVHSPMQVSAARIDEFVCSHAAWINTHLARQQARLLAHPPPSEADLARLKADAAQYIPARVRHYQALWACIPRA